MNAEILCVGTEVLMGDIVNTNAAYLAGKLSEIGVNVYYHTVCGDNRERTKMCLGKALERSDLVVTTGGLGPTYDDMTKEFVCDALKVPLVYDENVFARLQAYFERNGKVMHENAVKQAYVPQGAALFVNPNGTADGIALEKDGKTVIMLPGPPREMQPMVTDSVIPYLKKFTDHVLVSHNIRIFGMGEADVEYALGDVMKSSVNPTVAPYIKDGEVRLRVSANGRNTEEAEKIAADMIVFVRNKLGNVVYGVDAPNIESVVVQALKAHHKTVAFAESCTGGLIAKRITDVSGSGDVFGFGFVTYANEAKMQILGVKKETLDTYGAVSEQTAYEMATGARRVSGADIAVSVTGIAGPTGGTKEKPVGLVYMGVASKRGCEVKKLMLAKFAKPDRAYIRTLTAANAFSAILKTLNGEKP